MNYIDLAIILIAAVGLALGLLGKLWKRIIVLVMIIASIPISFWIATSTTNKYADKPVSEIALLKDPRTDVTVTEWVVEKANSVELVETLYNNSESFKSLIDNTPKMIVKILLFYVFGLAGFIIAPILGQLIYLIIKLFMSDKEKQKGAIWMFGIPSGVMSLIIALFIISPVIVFSPILDEATKAYKSMENPNATVVKVLETVNNQTSGSLVIKTGNEYLKKNEVKMLTYEVQEGEETKKYYFYGEINDIAVIISLYNEVAPDIQEITTATSMDLSSSEAVDDLVGLLDVLENVLGNLDVMRENLSDNGHISRIINELLEYYLETYPDTLSSDSGLYFLTKIDMGDNFDYAGASLKNDILPKLLQALIDRLAEEDNYAFLASLDISSMSFSDIKKEIANLGNIVSLYNSLSTGDITDMSSEEIEQLIASLGESQIVNDVLESVLDQIGYDLPANFNVEDIDFAQEAPLIADIVQIAQNPDDLSSIDLGDLADDIAGSTLAEVIVLDVSASEYAAIQAQISSQGLTPEQEQTLLALFNNAG